MTNIVLLSLALVTNRQQAIVGQTNSGAFLATAEVISQVAVLGYRDGHGRLVSLGELRRVVAQDVFTNIVPVAFVGQAQAQAQPRQEQRAKSKEPENKPDDQQKKTKETKQPEPEVEPKTEK